ncbi:MAG: CU044_2847 family protein, partial [Cyanobacteria bacterium J06607_6]
MGNRLIAHHVNSIIRQLKRLETPAEEVEVKFGLKLSAEAGVVLTSVGGGEANYEITLKF